MAKGLQYKVVESDYRRYVGKCSGFGNGCTWLIRLSLRQRKGLWEVKRYNGPHTIKVLLNATAAHFGFRPTYRRVWLAKQKDVALIYGDWDESYNELPRWVLGVQLTMLGTVAVLRTSPVRVGGQLDESQAYFHRLFWTFPPCIEDGNSNILPVAFALVEGENAESWAFFLSDLPANFALTFKGKDARRLLVNAAYAKTDVEFHYWFDILRFEDPAMCEWTNRIEYSLWTQYCDEGRRFGHMTTNISECVNSILKGVRNLPVCSLVKATYGRLAELFVRKGREAEAQQEPDNNLLSTWSSV
ncbi:uncharacterized protein [Arachis hypogaea]|uniref:uncharacterized protein n=1 Tax=Arachis hypogaea TaxID=3818 RepID=UPI003B212D61